MRSSIVGVAALLALALPSSSGAKTTARWLTYPTCSATASALTCTGRAAGLHMNYLASVGGTTEAFIWATFRYTCNDDPSVIGLSGSFQGDPAAGVAAYNGRTFTITLEPRSVPDFPEATCPSGNWTRDPSYYSVAVTVTEGFWLNPVLAATFGTVSP